MRAITVCVDYADLLSLTLPYNRHHFEEVWVVTSLQDVDTYNLWQCWHAQGWPVKLVRTDSFYSPGSVFAKWAALEEGLEQMGRHGWLAILDADILWPRTLPQWRLDVGCLYTPLRRMFLDLRLPLPAESDWTRWSLHPQQREWAGYTQVFHASDPALGKSPWYDARWKHAGGADSFFQEKWPESRKLRPPFEVLHLGESGRNWCGRVTPYTDGSVNPEAKERERQLQGFLIQRRRSRQAGNDPYWHEKHI